MTAAQTRSLELFQALSPAEQEALLPRLAQTIEPEEPELSAEELAALDEGLDQVRRGETFDGDEVLDRIAARFNFSRA